MAGTLNEKDLEHLDKQTLITLLVSSNASNAALLRQVEQLTDSIELLNKEVKYLRSAIFGRSSEKEIPDRIHAKTAWIEQPYNKVLQTMYKPVSDLYYTKKEGTI